MDLRKYIQAQKFKLQSSLSTTETTITLQSMKLPDGSTEITTTDIGGKAFMTLEPGTSNEEVISFTTITQNASGTATLTGVTRGLKLVAPYSETTTFKKSHGSGSIAVLTNTSSFYDEFVNKKNEETISGTLSVPTPTADAHASTKAYVDTVATGGAVSHNRNVVAGTAGTTVAAGNLIYFDETDNEWKKADASVTGTTDNIMLGIAQGSGVDGGAISGGVLIYGLDSNQTGMTIGDAMYISDTAGAIASSAGTVERVIGYARTATELYFDPNFKYILTKLEQDAISVATKPVEIEVFESDGTWTKLTGAKYIEVICIGAGGGGAGGEMDSGGSGDGGHSGGGGAFNKQIFNSDMLSATETVTVGVGGVGTAGRTTNGHSSQGGNGSLSSFGSYIKGGGGGGGQSSSDTNGGAGGGILTSASYQTPGTPTASVGVVPIAEQAAIAGTTTGSVYGGSTANGGSSVFGGCAGGYGGGGSIAATVGSDGGSNNTMTAGGGASGGAEKVSGSNGKTYAADGVYVGTGGGGGGGCNRDDNDSSAGDGGDGGTGCGGAGGGGSADVGNDYGSGAGGDGGDGLVVVITHF